MKLNVGDKIRFLNAVGGGKITSLKGDIAMILTDDGFEYPSHVNELLRVESDNFDALPKPTNTVAPNTKEQKNSQPTKKQPFISAADSLDDQETKPEIIKGNDTLRLFLGFVPVDDRAPTNCDLDVYLINDSNFHILYTYYAPEDKELRYKKHGKIDPNTKWKLDTVARNELTKMERVLLHALPFSKANNKIPHPLDIELEINTVWFFRLAKFKENDFFEEDSLLFELTENPMQKAVEKISKADIEKIVKKQEIENTQVDKSLVAKQKKERFAEELVIDLHIHELVDDEKGMSNGEMLEIQLKKFEHELTNAQKTPTKRMVFIHGVGNGKLKLELRKKLDKKYPKLQYQDASFAEYGWGATMVYLY